MNFKTLTATSLALLVAPSLASAQNTKAAPAQTKPAPAQTKPAAPATSPTAPALSPEMASKASYGIGLSMGQNLKQQDLGLSLDQVIQGIKDGYSGAAPKVDAAEIQQALEVLQQQFVSRQREMIVKRQAEMQAEAAKNQNVGQAYLEANKKKPGVKTTASGLQYQILQPGTGPSPKPTDTVKVNYTGTTIDGTVFDSTDQHGQPAVFPLNKVIKGWTEGIPLMKVGGKARFVLPPDLAYGASPPRGAEFGPNAVLIFDVELLGIEKAQ